MSKSTYPQSFILRVESNVDYVMHPVLDLDLETAFASIRMSPPPPNKRARDAYEKVMQDNLRTPVDVKFKVTVKSMSETRSTNIDDIDWLTASMCMCRLTTLFEFVIGGSRVTEQILKQYLRIHTSILRASNPRVNVETKFRSDYVHANGTLAEVVWGVEAYCRDWVNATPLPNFTIDGENAIPVSALEQAFDKRFTN